jgi:hypothetical protein
VITPGAPACQNCGMDAEFYCELLECNLCAGCCEDVMDPDMDCSMEDRCEWVEPRLCIMRSPVQ